MPILPSRDQPNRWQPVGVWMRKWPRTTQRLPGHPRLPSAPAMTPWHGSKWLPVTCMLAAVSSVWIGPYFLAVPPLELSDIIKRHLQNSNRELKPSSA